MSAYENQQEKLDKQQDLARRDEMDSVDNEELDQEEEEERTSSYH